MHAMWAPLRFRAGASPLSCTRLLCSANAPHRGERGERGGVERRNDVAHNAGMLSHEEYKNERIAFFKDHSLQEALSFPPLSSSRLSHPSISAFRDEYDYLQAGESLPEERTSIAGRVVFVRSLSKKLHFVSLCGHKGVVQITLSRDEYHDTEEFAALVPHLRRGDVISAQGFPKRMQRGELSIMAQKVTILSPCLRPLPWKNRLHDKETRFRNRHLDMLVNDVVVDTFKQRSKIISCMRSALETRGFLEVETPILAPKAGGATARPFITLLHDSPSHAGSSSSPSSRSLYLRIAPELYLKQLVVGGMHRVYEIGKQFRNEGMDSSHNPEFTTCEFYWAFSDYKDMMAMVEDMVREIVSDLHPSLHVPYTSSSPPQQHNTRSGADQSPTQHVESRDIDFESPFAVIDIAERITQLAGREVDFEDVDDVLNCCEELGVAVEAPLTISRCVDAIISLLIEPLCVHPTFLLHHPRAMCPLARSHRHHPKLTERFELFVAGKEIANAYTELNDPSEQQRRFAQQHEDRIRGDGEAPIPDMEFVSALEYALPPTSGCGIGVDRLVMLLTNKHHIREVIPFPMMGETSAEATLMEEEVDHLHNKN